MEPNAHARPAAAGGSVPKAKGEEVTRVVLADDHPLFLEALRSALEAEQVEVVGAVGRGDDLLELVAERRPDVVLLDLDLPGLDGMSCLRELRVRSPKVRVVIVSAHDDPALVEEALAAGATTFVAKTADTAELLRAVELPRRRPPRPPRASTELGLTSRELEILRLAADGHSNAALARILWLSEPTVKSHLSSVYRKLGVGSTRVA
jgi:DNA-binding NarL/FixJ family response regulator